MANFPSKLAFASLLQYAPRVQAEPSVLSRDVTYKIKQDGYVGELRIIDYATLRLGQVIADHPFLGNYFNASVTLVPVPRSSPLKHGALWPPRRICESLKARGLATNVMQYLERKTPVQKSATAPVGQRPSPETHYESIEVNRPSLFLPHAITLVDDDITRGASFVGILPRLQESFPGIEIRCFALVRTMSGCEIQQILDPVEGNITYNGVELHRYP